MKTILSVATVPTNEETVKECVNSIIETVEQEYTLVIVRNDWKGFATAHNKNLKTLMMDSSYEGIVIINDDMILKERWLEEYQKVAKQGDCIVGCENRGENLVGFGVVYIPRLIALKVGYLDENYRIGEWEDIDYCCRVLDAGFKLRFIEHSENFRHHKGSVALNKKKHEGDKFFLENREYFLQKFEGTKWEDVYRK